MSITWHHVIRKRCLQHGLNLYTSNKKKWHDFRCHIKENIKSVLFFFDPKSSAEEKWRLCVPAKWHTNNRFVRKLSSFSRRIAKRTDVGENVLTQMRECLHINVACRFSSIPKANIFMDISSQTPTCVKVLARVLVMPKKIN